MKERTYLAIDLKSFYASVECLERGLDPMRTNLVVADTSRTVKTICLAVTPSLKRYGIPGRARLFEVEQKLRQVNLKREHQAPGRRLCGASCDAQELDANPQLAVDYIAAPPRMAYYIKKSTQVYRVYMKYIAPEDIHVYSIDEVFMDVTNYLDTYGISPHDLAMRIILDVLKETGITATAGIGTNLFLSKIAMDITAKHIPPDENGVRIAQLDEMSYRQTMWDHTPITDFWRVGRGYAKKLEMHGMYTMGDIARCSIRNESLLYDLFGINAELLIDHAWGWEPCTISDIKQYKPSSNSIGSGQVLSDPYDFEKARLVVREMADMLVLELVAKGLMTDQIALVVGYDIENLSDEFRRTNYSGEITTDAYGRRVPKAAHGTVNLGRYTSSTREIMNAVTKLYEEIVQPKLLIRRINLTANHVLPECDIPKQSSEQLDLFTDYEEKKRQEEQRAAQLNREKKMQQAMLEIKKKFGKNAILKGMNLQQGATAQKRNEQIGGHKA